MSEARAKTEVVKQNDRFIFKKQKDYARQFSHVYISRLKILGDLLKERAQSKWGDKHPIKELRDLRESSQEVCILIGTLFKQQTLRPSVLKDISEKNQLVPQPVRTNFVDESDKLILEDTLQRIKIVGKLDVHNVVTGVVCAVLGYGEGDGVFIADDYLYYESGPQRPLSPLPDDRYILLLSGFNLSEKVDLSSQFQLLKLWVYGNFPNLAGFSASALVRIIIAGNSVDSPHTERKNQIKKQTNEHNPALDAVKELDTFTSDLAKSVAVDLMPGEKDPANFMLPQQPMHACMFPKSRENSNFTSVSNPYQIQLDGRQIVGSAGQNIKDVQNFSKLEDPLEALAATLTWSHIAPTCPDTLACYPYYQTDPFIITEMPHIYFAGNCEAYKTKMYENAAGAKVRLVCVPEFSQTKTGVLVNLKNLDTRALQLDF